MLKAEDVLRLKTLNFSSVANEYGTPTCISYTVGWIAVGTFSGDILVFDALHNLDYTLTGSNGDSGLDSQTGKVTCLAMETPDTSRNVAYLVAGFDNGLVCRWVLAKNRMAQITHRIEPAVVCNRKTDSHALGASIVCVRMFPNWQGQCWLSADCTGAVLLHQVPKSLFILKQVLTTRLFIFDYYAVPQRDQILYTAQVHEAISSDSKLQNAYYLAVTTPSGLFMQSVLLSSNTAPKQYFMDYVKWQFFHAQHSQIPTYKRDIMGIESVSNAPQKPQTNAMASLCAFSTLKNKVYLLISVGKVLFQTQLLLKTRNSFDWQPAGALALPQPVVALSYWTAAQALCLHTDGSVSIVNGAAHPRSPQKIALWPFEQEDLCGLLVQDRFSFATMGHVTSQIQVSSFGFVALPVMNESICIDSSCQVAMVLFGAQSVICMYQPMDLQARLESLDTVAALSLGRAAAKFQKTACFHVSVERLNAQWLTDWLLNFMVEILADELGSGDDNHLFLLLAALVETAGALRAFDFIYETICETCYDLNLQSLYWDLLESLILSPHPETDLEKVLDVPINSTMSGPAINLMLRYYSGLPHKHAALESTLPLLPLEKCDKALLFGLTLYSRLWVAYAAACSAFQYQIEGTVVLLKNALQNISVAENAEAVAAFCEHEESEMEQDLLVSTLFELLEKSLCGEPFSSKWPVKNKERLEGEAWRFLFGNSSIKRQNGDWTQVAQQSCFAELAEVAKVESCEYPYVKSFIFQFPMLFYAMMFRIFDGTTLDGSLIIMNSGDIGRASDRIMLGLEASRQSGIDASFKQRVMEMDSATEMNRQYVLDRLYDAVFGSSAQKVDWTLSSPTRIFADLGIARFFSFAIRVYATHRYCIELEDLFLRRALIYIVKNTIYAAEQHPHRLSSTELKLREAGIRELLQVFDPIFAKSDYKDFPDLLEKAHFFSLCQDWYRKYRQYDKLLPCMLRDEENRLYALDILTEWFDDSDVRCAIPWDIVWDQIIHMFLHEFVEQVPEKLVIFTEKVFGPDKQSTLLEQLNGKLRYKYLKQLADMGRLSRSDSLYVELVILACSYDAKQASVLFSDYLEWSKVSLPEWKQLANSMQRCGLVKEQCQCLLQVKEYNSVYDTVLETLSVFAAQKDIASVIDFVRPLTSLLFTALRASSEMSLKKWMAPVKVVYQIYKRSCNEDSGSLSSDLESVLEEAAGRLAAAFSVTAVLDCLSDFDSDETDTRNLLPLVFSLLQQQKNQACLSQVELEYLQTKCYAASRQTAQTSIKGYRVRNYQCIISKTPFDELDGNDQLLIHIPCGHVSILSVYSKAYNYLKKNFDFEQFKESMLPSKAAPCIYCNLQHNDRESILKEIYS